jgi:hypothetical protein
MEKEFKQYIIEARAEFVKSVTDLYPHEAINQKRPERLQARVSAENILIAFDQLKERLEAAAGSCPCCECPDCSGTSLIG